MTVSPAPRTDAPKEQGDRTASDRPCPLDRLRTRAALPAGRELPHLPLASSRAVLGAAPDLVLCMTDPPFVGAIGPLVARPLPRAAVVISQDVFPEIAVELGRLGTRLVALLRLLVNSYAALRGPGRRDRRDDEAAARGERRRAGAIRVIPNWVDTRASRRARATTRGPASTASTAASSSCTPATSATPRISTRSSGPATSCVTSTTSPFGSSAVARADELVRLAELLEVGQACASSAGSRTRSARIALERRHPFRRPRARPRRLRRPEPPLRDSRRRTAGDRGGRRRERDRPVVARVGCGVVVPPGNPSCSRGRSAPRTTASSTSRRWGAARGRSPRPRATGRSRSRRYEVVLRELQPAS